MGISAPIDITSNITNIIWIDPNVDNKENIFFLEEMKKIKKQK